MLNVLISMRHIDFDTLKIQNSKLSNQKKCRKTVFKFMHFQYSIKYSILNLQNITYKLFFFYCVCMCFNKFNISI